MTADAMANLVHPQADAGRVDAVPMPTTQTSEKEGG